MGNPRCQEVLQKNNYKETESFKNPPSFENVLASRCLFTSEIKPLIVHSLLLASCHRVCGLGAEVGAIVSRYVDLTHAP